MLSFPANPKQIHQIQPLKKSREFILVLFPSESGHTGTITPEKIDFYFFFQKVIQGGITTDSGLGFVYDTHVLCGMMAS